MAFLDNLFKKKEGGKIRFSELDAWLDRQVEKKRLKEKILGAKSAITAKIGETRSFLDDLEHAGLKNENISVREKQVMEGHRKIYLLKMRKFLDEISVPDDFSEIGYYVAKFSESLNKLSEDTVKNYAVLSQFMEHELSKAVKGIKNIENELLKLRTDIEREGVENIKGAKIRLKQYQHDMKKRELLLREKAKAEEELTSLRSKKDKMLARLDELKKSKDYSDYEGFLSEHEKNEAEMKKIEQDLVLLFVELSRPIRKYKRSSPDEKLIDRYLLDPVGSLQDDTKFVINDIFRKMEKDLPALDLKDAPLEKAKELLKKADKDYLLKAKIDIERLKFNIKDAATKINRNVTVLNIEDAHSLLHSLQDRMARSEHMFSELDREVSKINLDYLKQRVRETVKEFSDVTIEDDKL